MKIVFFLLVIANAALFMWEYKSGAFAPARKTFLMDTSYQEQIWLVRERKIAVPDVQQDQNQKPATAEQRPVVTDKTEEN